MLKLLTWTYFFVITNKDNWPLSSNTNWYWGLWQLYTNADFHSLTLCQTTSMNVTEKFITRQNKKQMLVMRVSHFGKSMIWTKHLSSCQYKKMFHRKQELTPRKKKDNTTGSEAEYYLPFTTFSNSFLKIKIKKWSKD